ncbi:hypothetical protein [Candidatus Phytoplasma solani]|uniref:hypothetical protein n=1 Tax=Candidatus Phytoplasma solani TaxID=69896 RepID=UPI00358E4820
MLKSKIIIIQGNKKDQNYEIKKYDILKNISLSDDNALLFLKHYIKKVLQDLSFYNEFEYYFNHSNKNELKNLKEKYTQFIKNNTKIQNDNEIKRIFNKIINILAFGYNNFKAGVKSGKLCNIKKNDLLYNKENPIKKPKIKN